MSLDEDFRKNVTIYDIARRAGTSPSTVGSVMNGSWRSRRISEARADSIKKIADEMGYSVNLQASALRKEKSHIVGMIVPMHENRYFSSISQAFETYARERGLFPVISSTLRDPRIEEDAVRLFLDYQVERIICTGATDPDTIADICRSRGVPTINLDLPGSKAPSVISDNYAGALSMTGELIRTLNSKGTMDGDLLFVGGRPNDHATGERVRGFLEANRQAGRPVRDKELLLCGYAAVKAEAALARYFETADRMPSGIFVNSTISLEGVMNWFRANGLDRLSTLAFGCFDWDPFAALMLPDIIMVRQDVPKIVETLFRLIDDDVSDAGVLIQIPPSIIKASG